MRARSQWTELVNRIQPPVRKYRNQITEVDGYRFDSKLEADRYRELRHLQHAGEVLWFLRQVPFDVAPGVKYRADFLVLWNDKPPVFTVEDCKGVMTPASRVKIATVQERYKLRIRILTRKDVSR